MQIDIITLFPKMFDGIFNESIIKRAIDKQFVNLNIHDLRQFGLGERKTVDDRPYGGGVGMLLLVEPIYKALKELKKQNSNLVTKTVLLTPQGKPFKQEIAEKYSKLERLILIAGHYEGFDERIRLHLVDEEVSIGDYVLTGGEIPAMVITDAVVRLIPGVLSKSEATEFESFTQNSLEYPQYTRPENFNGWSVPEILLSGDHKKIGEWRRDQAKERTTNRRPDLLRE